MQRDVYEFISESLHDPILEWKMCRVTGEEFPIYAGDKEMLDLVAPRIGGVVYPLPVPTLCFRERDRRRMMRRNDRHIYRATCAQSGTSIISFYHPDKHYQIVDNTLWFEAIENTTLGQQIDFSRNMGEQLHDLMKKTIKQNTLVVGVMENSKFTHNVGILKDCYMAFDGGVAEQCFYTTRFTNVKQIMDCFEITRSEYCYECYAVDQCTNCFWLVESESCSGSAFCYQCSNCHHCIGCTNMVNASYCIENKQVSREEFQQAWDKIFSGSHQTIQIWKKRFSTLVNKCLKVALRMIDVEHSLGNNLLTCKDVFLSENCAGAEHLRYCKTLSYLEPKDSMDISGWGGYMSRCYELNCCGSDDKTTTNNCHMSSYLFYGVNNVQYSVNLQRNVQYAFACSEMHTKQYCILNTQYSQEEYEKLMPTIISHMQSTGERGEFLDPKYSPFPYNDTIAHDYYPLHKLVYPDGSEQLLDSQGQGILFVHEPEKTLSTATLDLGGEQKIQTTRRTKDVEVDLPEGTLTIDAKNLPDTLDAVDNSIYRKAVICEVSGRPFRITPQELVLYRKRGLPLPRLHPDIRHKERLQRKTPFDLVLRNCDKTGEKVLSVYPVGTSFNVYGQQAYEQEVFG